MLLAAQSLCGLGFFDGVVWAGSAIGLDLTLVLLLKSNVFFALIFSLNLHFELITTPRFGRIVKKLSVKIIWRDLCGSFRQRLPHEVFRIG
jgi:hypothetical protein